MSDFGVFIPIVSIIASAWVIVAVMRYRYIGRHGSRGQQADSVEAARDNARLAHENEDLKLNIRKLEQRLAVLERIATDPAERTAREIENLR